MRNTGLISAKRRRTHKSAWALSVLLCGLTVPTHGNPPIDPLPAPLFSYDLDSPQVQDSTVGAAEILGLGPPDLDPRFAGWAFGFGISTDDLDAHSVANSNVPPVAPFALLFSVDTVSVGATAPDPHFVSLGVPYNAKDQALRGQAAGDQFMSTSLFLREGSQNVIAAVDVLNNVLVRNNFDEGGTDFVALPPSSARDYVVNESQDRVDATAVQAAPSDTIYFSATSASPSLYDLPGHESPSGADIFVFAPPPEGRAALKSGTISLPSGRETGGGLPPCHIICGQQADEAFVDCRNLGGTMIACSEEAHEVLWACLETTCGVMPPVPPSVFAPFFQLGLHRADDIDALIVFDTNADGVFNGTDRVLFSLTADSPSLATIPGTSPTGAAADVFISVPGGQVPTLLASAAALGLGHSDDNIDALDYTLCDNVDICAALHGIRSDTAVPALSGWGTVIVVLLMLGAITVIIRQRQRSSVLRPGSTG